MNPRNPRFNRPQRSGRGRNRPAPPPILMGEPSPSLAKINGMNMEKLQAKITSLEEEKGRLEAKLERLKALDPQPQEKIAVVADLLARLEALKEAAATRLAGKAERKAAREQGGGGGFRRR